MIIATVNVNGIRAAARKGFHEWLEQAQPDVLLLQEVRAPAEIARELVGDHYRTWLNPSAIAGRAGVAVAVKRGIAVGEVRSGLPSGIDDGDWYAGAEQQVVAAGEFADGEGAQPPRVFKGEVPVDTGRWLEVDIPTAFGPAAGITVISAYLHSGVATQPEKMAAKYAHLERVNTRLAELAVPEQRPLKHVLMAGDLNIVHTAADITNWKSNHNKTSGVLDDEIAYLDRWFADFGFVDVQRALTGSEQVAYTWWSNRGKAFDNNVGWRIDYQITDPQLAQMAHSQRVDRAASYAQRWSDHAPLVINYSAELK